MKDKAKVKAKRPRWLEKLLAGGKEVAEGASKHGRAKRKPKGWRRALRSKRKRQRQAKLLHRKK